MIVFRVLCALLMAWAMNLALARPEAEQLITNIPHMKEIGPIAGAIVGYANLASRQGWGMIVAFANGIWAGVLAIAVSGVLGIGFIIVSSMRENVLQDFDDFLLIFRESLEPLLEELPNVPLLVVSLGSAAVVGVITEVIHWLLVRVRGEKGKKKPTT